MANPRWIPCPDTLCVNGRVRLRDDVHGDGDPAGAVCHRCGGRGWVAENERSGGCITNVLGTIIAVVVLAVIGLTALSVAFVVIADLLSDDPPSLDATRASPEPGEDPQYGDCLAAPYSGDSSVVDCSSPYIAQAFAVFDVRNPDGDVWPGRDPLREWARGECRKLYPQRVDPTRSTELLGHNAMTPTEAEWNADDRLVVCIVHHSAPSVDELRPLVGSLLVEDS